MVDAPLINKMAVKHHDLEMETLDSSTMRTTVEFVISLGHLPSHIGIAGWTHQDNNNNITTFCPIGHQGQRSWSHGFLFVFFCVCVISLEPVGLGSQIVAQALPLIPCGSLLNMQTLRQRSHTLESKMCCYQYITTANLCNLSEGIIKRVKSLNSSQTG